MFHSIILYYSYPTIVLYMLYHVLEMNLQPVTVLQVYQNLKLRKYFLKWRRIEFMFWAAAHLGKTQSCD